MNITHKINLILSISQQHTVPGLSNAGSRMSTLLVAMTTLMFCVAQSRPAGQAARA